jgi:molybdate transport system substrate-binding protein
VRHRKLAILVGVLLVLVFFAGVAYVVLVRSDDSNVITRTVPGATGGDDGAGGDAKTISIYAPSELSKVLELLTTSFQQERPGTTFQYTLGPTNELIARVKGGQKPNLYIDTKAAIDEVSAGVKPVATPVAFGYDVVQLAVPLGNPKQVSDMSIFAAGSPYTSGLCAQQLPCGVAGAQTLQRAGVNAAPKVTVSNVDELLAGVRGGRVDGALMLRSETRRALARISKVAIPPDDAVRIDYQAAHFGGGGATDEFINWLQGSPTARGVLRTRGLLGFWDP